MFKFSRRSILALAAFLTLVALDAQSAMAAPSASFTVSPAPGQSGVPVTLTSTSTAPLLATITNVEWDFDGNGSFDATGETVQHTFPTAGTYAVTMRATSSELIDNQASATQDVVILTRPPTALFTFNPANPSVGDGVLFASNSTDPDGEALTHTWDFGDGSGPSSARNPTHEYATPGTKTVRLTVNDGRGGVDDVTHQVVVRDPSAATARFRFAPEEPMAGQTVTFTSTSTPSAGQSITSQSWDLDSDGQYDDGQGRTVTRSFASAGVYRVALRVVQANGNPAVAEGTVRVGAVAATPPGGAPAPPTGGPTSPGATPRTRLAFLSPFPVVRLRGRAYPQRTVVTLLSILAPRGALVRVRCLGKSCPKAVRRKRSKGRPVRFKTFERSIAAGAKLEILVVAPGRIGKYTSFKMLKGKPPVRRDLCVVSSSRRPRPCPT